jgi:hypothetical protein
MDSSKPVSAYFKEDCCRIEGKDFPTPYQYRIVYNICSVSIILS